MAYSSQFHKSLVLNSQSEPLSLQNLPLPEATAGSVVVRILSAIVPPMAKGIFTGQIPFPLIHPIVPGSTAIGRIFSLGNDSTVLAKDQLVFVSIQVNARDDPTSSILQGWTGWPGLKLMAGEWRNGTWAEYAKVPLENVFALDEDRLVRRLGYKFNDLNWIGPCSVPMGGLSAIDIKAGETVIVSPATGWYGGAAVQMAVGMGAKVIACGRNAGALQQLEKVLGSNVKGVPSKGNEEADTAALKEAVAAFVGAGSRGADAYLDMTPGQATKSNLSTQIQALRPGGRVALMGAPGGDDHQIPYLYMVLNNISIKGRYMLDRAQIEHVIQLVHVGSLKLGPGEGSSIEVKHFTIDEGQKAVDFAAENKGWGTMAVLFI